MNVSAQGLAPNGDSNEGNCTRLDPWQLMLKRGRIRNCSVGAHDGDVDIRHEWCAKIPSVLGIQANVVEELDQLANTCLAHKPFALLYY